ncbi:MAG: helix-turn-helix domain-containing protein [Aureibaculum sp.]|nr:helix-turn-helix domain-containing protein [Aureibaculum sp.]
MPILHGVLLYFYVMEITGNKLKKRWTVLLHLIPTLSLVILAIPFYILSGEQKIYVFQNEGAGFEWYILYINILIPLSGLIYSVWSLIVIKRHQLKIQNSFSNTDKKELQWLKYLSIGYFVIWILAIFFESEIIFTAVVVLVLFIGFFGINQLNIFYSNIEPVQGLGKETISKTKKTNNPNKDSVNTINEKYAKSGLNEGMASEIYTNLNRMMEDSSSYQDENLTLVELSQRLEVHPNHLSQVINEMEDKNFYNYINSLRIKAFIKLASLPENKKYTMISLAYDCGFSTKSTFNKHFKLHTGKTPTEFFNTSSI